MKSTLMTKIKLCLKEVRTCPHVKMLMIKAMSNSTKASKAQSTPKVKSESKSKGRSRKHKINH